jgi:hypothetical protein
MITKMVQHSKHLLKINGVFVSSIKISEDSTPYFLDNQFGWLVLDNTLDIEVCHIQDPEKLWKRINVEILLNLPKLS